MGQRLVGQALKEHGAGHDLPVKIVRRIVETRLGVVAAQRPVERVQVLPHLRGDDLANAAGVFPGPAHTADQAVGVFMIEGQILNNPCADRSAGVGGRLAPHDVQYAIPLLFLELGGKVADIDQQVGVHQ